MLLSLLYFILILGLIVLVHEFGHFFFSKLFGIYVYEFAIGMGPKLFSWKSKKGETEYSIRLIPIGGFCALAGEDVETDDEAKIPKERRLYTKPAWQRFLVMFFGAGNNFILALIVLFVLGLGWGSVSNKAVVSDFAHYITVSKETSKTALKETGLKTGDKILKINDVAIDANENEDLEYFLTQLKKDKKLTITVSRDNVAKEIKVDNKNNIIYEIMTEVPKSAAEKAGIKVGDKILKIDGHKVKYSDDVSLYIQIYGKGKGTTFTVDRNGKKLDIDVVPDKEKVSGTTVYRVGIISQGDVEHGFIPAVKYTFHRFEAILRQMVITLKGLCTGGLSIKQLSGPVGIYNVVDSQSKAGFQNVLYLIALLSINVGFINLIPLPAFDGGRILFLIIEKIKGSPVSPELEGKIHTIGFILLIALMLYITFYDILRLF